MAPEPSRVRCSGRPHVAGISSHLRERLDHDWYYARLQPGGATSPGEMEAVGPWSPATVPGTVATTHRAGGLLPELDRVEDYDASDWWYRCRFETTALDHDESAVLRFEGLATLAEIWLNGEMVGASANMFRELEVDVTSRLRDTNDLYIRFRSLHAELVQRRARPRWHTSMVEHQQLRWFRTTLLGRMPGWCPPVRPVGPWRPIWLERRRIVAALEGDVIPSWEGAMARVSVDLEVQTFQGISVTDATLVLPGKESSLRVSVAGAGTYLLAERLDYPRGEAWWPHTHGPQPLYPATIRLTTTAGPVQVNLGKLAFRSITARRLDDGFGISVNDVPIFCRGACWSTPDIVSLYPSRADLERTLRLAQAANMNMLRIGGTMLYEDHRFYELCDELGLLVWQDFMYASMDYPAEDTGFLAEAAAEAAEIVSQRRRFACMAVYCGGSEVEQRAAMMGLPREEWSSILFERVLPDSCETHGSGTPYVANSPTGGPLPFSVNAGIAHYYGVGAYLRPLEDARRAEVRFTSESLGFSNVPESATLESFLAPSEVPPHHPRWKARVPRENAAGWDFDDVRDFYLKLVFGVDPLTVRYSDVERYLALSRLTTGEVMARTFAEWRAGGVCRGGLVWCLQDVWPGAGWGVIDALGQPKAAWHYLRRVFAPLAVFLSNEGVNGIDIHLMNDTATAFQGEIRLTLYRHGAVIVGEGSAALEVPAHGHARLSADTVLGRFFDVSGAYRFGPPGHDVVLAELREAGSGLLRSSDMLFPHGLPAGTSHPGLRAHVVRVAANESVIELESERLAFGVHIEGNGWAPRDNYFHMGPGSRATVLLSGPAAARPSTVHVRSLNGGSCHVRLASVASPVASG